VQELGRHQPVSVRSPVLKRFPLEEQLPERAEPGPSVQLIARDAFVSEMAVKVDRALIEIASLGRELQLVKSDFAELKDEGSRSYRFSEFLEREHRARSSKLDELSRRFDFMKDRLDAIDGNSKGDYEAFRNFEAVSRRLTELGKLEREFRQVSWKLKLSVALFAASVLVWLAVVVAM